MSERISKMVSSSETVSVYEVDCHAPKSRIEVEEFATTTQVIVPKRGVFGIALRGKRILVEPTTAFLLRAGVPYVADHPASCGDRCTVAIFDDALLEDTLGDSAPDYGPISAATQLAARLLAAGQRTGSLVTDERAVFFLESLAEDLAMHEEVRLGPFQLYRVDEVRALLATDPAHAWRLEDIARRVHVSSYHLARQFRAATGITISRYLARLRIGLVLDRLQNGEPSLARIAVESGFAHHSHLSERFRAMVGVTPSAVRRILSR
jgi:AraC-like DNA-binding protein